MSSWSGGPGLELGKRLREGLGRVLARDVAWWAVVSLLWIGLVLRARGMWTGRTISLWEDEAAWAMRLVDLPLEDNVLRSIGFMAVSKGLVTLFSESERVLRFLPWCGGVGALFVSPLLAKQLFRSRGARLLFIAVIALHPAAIDLSKEFKPYSLALLLHMLLLLFVLRYRAQRSENDLLAAVGVAFFGVLFSQDVVFTYPMVFGLIALLTYRQRSRSHFALIAAGAAFALVLTLALRHNVVDKLGNADENIAYWGGKYNVFYVPSEGSSRFGWTLARLGDLASLPGSRRELWHWSALSFDALARAQHIESWLWILGCGLGIAVLLRQKRFFELTMLLAPIVTMMGFNYFGYWPLGSFRTNLFTLAYFAALAAVAVDAMSESASLGWQIWPVAALVLLPFLTIGSSNHARKTAFSATGPVRQAVHSLIEIQGKRRGEVLVTDSPNCAPWRYYAHYHPGEPKGKELTRRFQYKCGKSTPAMLRFVREGLTRPGARAYVLASTGPGMKLIDRLPPDLLASNRQVIGDDDAVLVSVTKAAPAP